MRIAAAVTTAFVAVMGAVGIGAYMNGPTTPPGLPPPTAATSAPAAQPAPVTAGLTISGDVDDEDGFDDD